MNAHQKLDVLPQIVAKLREKNQEHMEVERANENMR